MKIIMLAAGSFAFWALQTGHASAAECPAQAQQINDSNSLVLLGGTAKGKIKQVVVGEFGKDVNQQKRILGQFDRCGALLRADISYDKNEGNMMLRMVQSVARVTTGWQAVYDMSVFVIKEGQPVEVNRKQGTIDYLISKKGIITSSTDAFLLKGEKGFTETTNSFDSRLRLVKSVARGSDVQANGEYRYQWNSKDQLLTSSSANSKMSWTYDKQNREQRLLTVTHSDNSDLTSVDECQLWDDQGNCTLSYSKETEVFTKGEINRHISAAYKFEYWER
ncbi:hypothetical protein SD961_11115 [Erwinia sp. MMLR14_017]|uniref:hypothetical protein n=1 Tax=Erwinia sp. MMLR14_017 TaxID=3093842 RepID=UPI00298F8FD4|nr:hypothetical protein [Erwinia sp. MMLR14_017]MDW8846434.1 hypothetical protein [Erwinia sp. MMLR14_017]